MRFKLIVVFIEDEKTDLILKTARDHGATGATVISNARGEGVVRATTFFGLALDVQRDVVMLVVEEHLSRPILEAIARAGQLDDQPGTGIAFQIDVEDALGVSHQVKTLTRRVEEEL